MRILGVLAPLALAAAPAARAAAQAAPAVVRGTVVDTASGRLVGGLTVRVVDAAGTSVTGAITDAAGRFTLRVAPGRYALRVQRVGYRSTETPTLAVRADTSVRLVAPRESIGIDAVRTLGRSECAPRAMDRAATAALWDEARKALDAAALARAQQLLRLTVADYVRELDASGEVLVSERRAERSGTGLQAYRSRHPDTLEAHGYVRLEGDVMHYDTPDADVLLSDGFVRTHCFRLRNDPARPHVAGLAFEPVKGRKQPDVRGVLWVDRDTRELLSLDYTYTSYPEARWPQAAGGRVEFARLPSGAWMIRRWAARAPVLENAATVQMQRTGSGNPIGGGESPRYTTRPELRLVGVRELAGEVLSAATLDGVPLFAQRFGSLAGTVTDSLTGRPLAGALVVLAGTGRVASADDAGRWRFDAVPVGSFGVTFSHPAADSLVVEPPEWRASVEPDRETRLALALPAPAALKARVCAADFGSTAAHGAVVGVVTDGDTGVPVPGAAVAVAWSTFAKAAGGAVLVENVKEATATTDAAGRYRVCTVPADGDRVTVRAQGGGRESAPVVLQLAPGGIARRDLALRAPAER